MDFDRERWWADRCFHHDLPAVPMDILQDVTAAYYRPTTYLHVLITVQSSRIARTFRPIAVGSEATVAVLQQNTLSPYFQTNHQRDEEYPVTQGF